MSRVSESYSAEDRMMREYQVASFACRQLSEWALAHFGERTDPHAYANLVISLSTSGPDYAIDKIYRDLKACGYSYRNEAIWRMYERYRVEGERRYPISRSFAA